MNAIKRLVGETAIYGLSTAIPRALNFLVLTPLYTNTLFNQADYGIIGKLLAYVAVLNVLFTYGMETSFFRFATKAKAKKPIVQTLLTSLLVSTLFLSGLFVLFALPLSNVINESGKTDYIFLFIAVVALDTLCVVPFSDMRLRSQPGKYLLFKVINILVNILLNLLFFWPAIMKDYQLFSPYFEFVPAHAVYYAFIAYIAASTITLLLLFPFYITIGLGWSWNIFKPIWKYTWPLTILGFAGMINEVFDRTVIDRWLTGTEEFKADQLGIYNACYKVGIILSMVVTAFRMGAEPFFFKNVTADNAKQIYARVMKYFVIFSLVLFLAVVFYIDLFKLTRFIGPEYWSGLYIAPYVVLAYVFFGIFYNLNIWYKLTDQTKFGMYITVAGAVVTVLLNYILLPRVGIKGAAIATLSSYVAMSVISYFLGKKHYPVPYETGKILLFIALAIVTYFAFLFFASAFNITSPWVKMAFNTIGLFSFIGFIVWFEKPKLTFLRKQNNK